MPRKLVIGTRGSPLALAQTEIVLKLLKKNNDGGSSFTTKVIKTAGDDLFRKKNAKLTGKDSFTRAIDVALASGEIDIAVHSLKDLPVEKSNRSGKLEIAALPKRASPFDVLISKTKGLRIDELPEGARIGTSSLRRALQLKAYRPDFKIVEIHGNVQTRIDKLHEENDLDALVLAEAGLSRVRSDNEIDQVLPKEIMLPAVGQGCLAVIVRSKDNYTKRLVSKIEDKETRFCANAERAFSRELGGGCNVPIAALGSVRNGILDLEGLAASSGKRKDAIVRDHTNGDPKDAENIGKKLALRIELLMK
jgi:hydroxymethylbilane synthase